MSSYSNRPASVRSYNEETNILMRCQRELSELGGFVTADSIENKYWKEGHGKRQNKSRYNEYLRNIDRMVTSVNTCINSAISTNIIITLHDIEEQILTLEDFKQANIANFADAKLGMLINHKTVQKHFKVAEELRDTPEIKTHNVLMHINKKFLEERARTKTDKETFLKTLIENIYNILDEYAKKKLSSNTATHKNLCIYIKNKAIAFWNFTISRFRYVNRNTGRKLLEQYEQESKHYFDQERRKAVSKNLGKGNAFLNALHNLLSSTQGEDVTKVRVVPGLLKRFFPTIKDSDTLEFLSVILVILQGRFHPESLVAREVSAFHNGVVRSMKKAITDLDFTGDFVAFLTNLEQKFVNLIKSPEDEGDHHMGCFRFLSSYEELSDSFQAKVKVAVGGSHKQTLEVSKSDLLEQTKDFMKKTEESDLLRTLAEVESKLLEFYRVASFESLGHGPFIKFCVDNSLDLSITTDSMTSQTFILHNSLVNFVRGMREANNVTRDQILRSLKRYVDFWQYQTVFPQIDQLISTTLEGYERRIPCLEWFLFDSTTTFDVQNETKALSVLTNAPLLTDLSRWSHWDSLFASSLGDFRTFLTKHITSGQLVGVIELQEDCFVRYVDSPSLDIRFVFHNEFICSGREVAAWFVGHIVKSRSLKLCSIAAIKEIITEQLQQVVSVEARISWILEALEALPRTILDLSGFEVFIQPIFSWNIFEPENVYSTLIDNCKTEEQRSALHRVGFSHAIQIWVDDFVSNKLQLQTKGQATSKNTTEVAVVQPLISQSVLLPVENDTEAKNPSNTHSIFAKIANKFGCSLDEHLSEEQQEQLRSLRALVTRSITRLSGELYSEDIHFLLELIQNADDNTYIDEVIPELQITVSHQCIALQNNEVGFDENNVEALCSIGESTKQNKKGYIGRKGIGFKSVFKVTGTPIIHSNEFHFGFDKSREDGLGFVVPIPQTSPSDWTDRGTRIILPISETSLISAANINTCIHDVTPSLLLFLHKLRRIKIVDQLKNKTREMERVDDLKRNIISLKDSTVGLRDSINNKEEKWLVVRKSLEIGTSQQTEIALAFPLNYKNTFQFEQVPQQPVFAYLPLRSYGFRFVIQADWATTSSRESVDGAQAGNQRLREEIAGVFCEASSEFIERANKARTQDVKIVTKSNLIEGQEGKIDFDDVVLDIKEEETSFLFNEKSMQWINFFLRFIPLPGQVSGEFFNSVEFDIWRKLQTTSFIPTMDNRWVVPSNAIDYPSVSTPDHILSRLMNELRLCGLSLINHHLDIPSSLKQVINLGKLDGRTIQRLLLNPTNSDLDIKAVCEWTTWLLDQLYLDPQFPKLIPELKDIPFILLSDGQYSSVSEGDIYMIESKSKNLLIPISRLLHPNIMLWLEKYPKAQTVLRRLGIITLDDHAYVEQMLLEKLKTSSLAPEVSEAVGFLKYAYSHASGSCEKCRKDKEWLLKKLENNSWWIATSDNRVISSIENVHAEPCPLNAITNWTTVSKDYYESEKASDLYPVLRAMGIHQFVVVNKRDISITEIQLQELHNNDSATDLLKFNEVGDDQSEVITVTDFYSSELATLLSHFDGDHKKVIFDVLLSSWDKEQYSSFLNLRVGDSDQLIPSSFSRLLHNTNWIFVGQDTFLKPRECCLRGGKAQKIIGGLGHFVENKPIFRDLGISDSLHWKQIIHHIEQWNSKPSFKTTINTMGRIYEQLGRELKTEADELMAKLTSMKFIFVPGHPVSCKSCHTTSANSAIFKSNDECEGHFYSIHQCVIADEFDIVDKVRGYTPEIKFMLPITQAIGIRSLQPYYSAEQQLSTFKEFGVPLDVSLDTRMEIWKKATEFESIESHNAVLRILGGFVYHDEGKPMPLADPNILSRVKSECLKENLLPCYSNNEEIEWHNSIRVFSGSECDSVEAAKFEPNAFICKMKGYVSNSEISTPKFLSMIGIPQFERKEHYQLIPSVSSPTPAADTGYLNVLSLVLQRYFESKPKRDVADKLKANFQSLEVFSSNEVIKFSTVTCYTGEVLKSPPESLNFGYVDGKLFLTHSINSTRMKRIGELILGVSALPQELEEQIDQLSLKWTDVTLKYLQELDKRLLKLFPSAGHEDWWLSFGAANSVPTPKIIEVKESNPLMEMRLLAPRKEIPKDSETSFTRFSGNESISSDSISRKSKYSTDNGTDSPSSHSLNHGTDDYSPTTDLPPLTSSNSNSGYHDGRHRVSKKENDFAWVESEITKLSSQDKVTFNSGEDLTSNLVSSDMSIDEIGRLSELVVYHYLKIRYGITPLNWVSTNRLFYYRHPQQCDDKLGYDLYYEEGSNKVYIEVKGSLSPSATFTISQNEIAQGQQLALNNDRYEIMRVFLKPVLKISRFDIKELNYQEPSEWKVSVHQDIINNNLLSLNDSTPPACSNTPT